MNDERWCIYVDMEGFSALYDQENQILRSLGEMMRAIYRIGACAYPSEPERLFVHQTGDGFAILSDFHEPSPIRAIAIAIVILRHVASTGRFARATISEGGLADIVGCYPKEVRDSRNSDGVALLGAGLMTLFPVMGTGLIRSVGIDKIAPSGPLLLLDPRLHTRIPAEIPTRITGKDNAPLAVDWIHLTIPLVADIQSRIGFRAISDEEIEAILIAYQAEFKLEKWVKSLKAYLNIDCERALS